MSLNAEAKKLVDAIEQRRAFEDWIGQPPYERSVVRWPDNEAEFSWPGQYKDIEVQLAWEAWQEGQKK